MSYSTKRKWMDRLYQFSPEQQKALLALSHDKYKWRTKDRLLSVTGLNEQSLEKTLSELISEDLVLPSFSQQKDIIFGLAERVS
uniref:Uncharacterized protein n=1 Tax=Candidatus Kentrum sp. MB TaxID=2138164 RepID=A0A450X712_9GAMM|nr:MAG: hypothetical protein BECKMB1821G_GA0114241_101141 [Candidatus Kentron sp. MB]VFK29861.1 MAG: hypothetical protein BECKMB1821I_GA0114274_101231 [Candidatus Kentron sp. MB]VFK74973.1 MAG: hypothetical protein BECKMB1821H_GA0114242_101331 [Candidatus Kentron sp. MB]